MHEIHIGSIIRCELRKQNKTNAWLAAQIGVVSRTINKIFVKEYIDTFLLLKISKAMNVDFFSYYSRFLKEEE